VGNSTEGGTKDDSSSSRVVAAGARWQRPSSPATGPVRPARTTGDAPRCARPRSDINDVYVSRHAAVRPRNTDARVTVGPLAGNQRHEATCRQREEEYQFRDRHDRRRDRGSGLTSVQKRRDGHQGVLLRTRKAEVQAASRRTRPVLRERRQVFAGPARDPFFFDLHRLQEGPHTFSAQSLTTSSPV